MSSESLGILADLCGSIAPVLVESLWTPADPCESIRIVFLEDLCEFKLIVGSMLVRWCASE